LKSKSLAESIIVLLTSDTPKGWVAGCLNAQAITILQEHMSVHLMDQKAFTNAHNELKPGGVYVVPIEELGDIAGTANLQEEEVAFSKNLGKVARKICNTLADNKASCRGLFSGGYKYSQGFFVKIFEWLYARTAFMINNAETDNTEMDFKIQFLFEDSARIYELPFYRFNYADMKAYTKSINVFHKSFVDSTGEKETNLGLSFAEFSED
jgi:hypothetical protein